MKKITAAILAVTILAVGVGLVFAQRGGDKGFGGKHHGEFMERIFERISEELNLSEEQKTQARQVLETSKTRIQPIMEQLKAGHQTAKTLGTDGTYNEAQVTALANSQAELTKQLIIEKEKTKAQLFAILTPEQRQTALQKIEEMKGRMKNRMPFGGGRFGGGIF